MKPDFVLACLLALCVFLAGCDKAPPAPSSDNPYDEAVTKVLAQQQQQQRSADLIKRAEQGDVSAQFNLGSMYANGEDVPKDVAKAFEWFQKAAAQGDAAAQFNLGTMYREGEGVPKDAAKAFEWIQKAAAQDLARAQYNLGLMYREGEGVAKDATKAFVWLQKVAAKGDALAQINLGQMDGSGEGVPKDAAKAVEWWQKAAAQGNSLAQLYIGTRYFFGDVIPKDTARAVEWLQKAAAQGNRSAQGLLSFAYSRGEGVPKDATKAFEWAQKAAEQGHASDQIDLGDMYYNGEGVPKDASKALEWYQKAAEQGDAKAQGKLGVMYFTGAGIPKDNVLAYAWLNVVASHGNENVAKMRAIVERSMTHAEIAEAQRLSSNWKKGQIIVREGRTISGSAAPSATSGSLSKKGTGTLFVVSTTGQAITNHHVVTGCRELRIEGRDEAAKVVTVDAVNDLALVQIPGEVKASAPITSEPGKLRQGEDIVVFGFPLNAVLSSGGNLTPGVVSALTGLGNNTNQIQITAPIQPGSSGSPVLNKKGEVVGVVSMKLSDLEMAKATGSVGQNVNFAVNGQTLRTFLDTHKVAYRSGSGFFSLDKSTSDLADEARKWTLLVECWK